MEDILPVGKLDMAVLNGLLAQYTGGDDRIRIGARVGEDAAVVDFGDRYMVTKTNPITFATREIGWYVVNVCVNNMVVRGLRPRWMLNCILLPEGKTTPAMVEDIFRQIYEASRQVEVVVIGGHTEVTYGLDRPIITGHLIGEVAKDALITTGGAQVGDTILITKALGIEGTAIIAGEKAGVLKERGYSDSFIERAKSFLHDPGISIYRDALAAAETRCVSAMTDATEGGLATALHEMAEAAGVGVLVEAEKVPLYPETQKLCAEFGLDPFGLIASGMMILTAPSEKVATLRHHMDSAGVPCSPIGTVTAAEQGRRLTRKGRVIELPYYAHDELAKIF
jgi:hydrogenase maturation factor